MTRKQQIAANLNDARNYKLALVDELNRVKDYEHKTAVDLEKEREGEARLAEINRLGLAVYAKNFERMYGEPFTKPT